MSLSKQFANSCRKNVGHIGRKGEIGTREELHQRLERNPDLNELHREMRRDKGYGGVFQNRKLGLPSFFASYSSLFGKSEEEVNEGALERQQVEIKRNTKRKDKDKGHV
jgi:hypothetical protein